jgi:hypothetical protein
LGVALARYSDRFWFPSGALAANIETRVFPEGSTAFASLFTDATGATPLANPTATNGAGVLTFWAESGTYWVHLDTESFLVSVGMTQEQADLSTGIASGGELEPNAGDPQAIDISALDGYIVDYLAGTQAQPVVTRIKTADQTVSLDAASLLRSVTWWLMDASANVIQQGTKPTPEQRRTHLVLGVTTFFSGAVVVVQTLPTILAQPANQLADLMDSLGPFSITGNIITANGVNLMLDQSAGTMFARAFSHFISGVLTDNPHIVDTQAQAPAQFRYITATGTVFGALRTTVDVANFDNAGVITPIGGGANTSSVHRLWLFGTGEASTQLAFQYGQNTYSSLSAAVNAIGQSGHVVNPLIVGNGALIAWVAVTRSATDLSDPTQAMIVAPAKFAAP